MAAFSLAKRESIDRQGHIQAKIDATHRSQPDEHISAAAHRPGFDNSVSRGCLGHGRALVVHEQHRSFHRRGAAYLSVLDD